MLDNSDLEAAVRSGVISADAADRMRVLAAERRAAPAADEERLGLVGGLSDIMCAVGLLLLLGIALTMLGSVAPIAVAPVAGGAWMLAEHFTRRRRLTLTSFVLFGLFVLSCALTCLGVALLMPGTDVTPVSGDLPIGEMLTPVKSLVVAWGCVVACVGWWWRFRLPIAYAGTVLAGINALIHVARIAAPGTPADVVSVILLGIGVALLVLAMWWDMTDIRRETARADTAFWLHVMAGYQIAGASFRLLIGVSPDVRGWDRLYAFTTQTLSPGVDFAVLALFGCFAVLALGIDRRSLLMASLAYALPAMQHMIGLDGTGGFWIGLMGVGLILLFLEGFWSRLRTRLLATLPPAIRAQLPRTAIATHGPRPIG